MTPHTATVTPTIAAATTNIQVRNRSTSRPREPAVPSPPRRRLRFDASARHKSIPTARTRVGTGRFSHLAAPKPPRLQKRTCDASCGSGEVRTMKLLTADNRAETAMPVRTNVPAERVCLRLAITKTSRSVRNAPANAANPRETAPPRSRPNRMTVMAPVAAPDDTPSTVGLASGLRSSACTTVPTVVSAIPATAARSTRGSRTSATILSIDAVQSTVTTPAGRARCATTFHTWTKGT